MLHAAVTPPKPGLVLDADGRVTITLTHSQLLRLETFAAQPDWKKAACDVAQLLRDLGL